MFICSPVLAPVGVVLARAPRAWRKRGIKSGEAKEDQERSAFFRTIETEQECWTAWLIFSFPFWEGILVPRFF